MCVFDQILIFVSYTFLFRGCIQYSKFIIISSCFFLFRHHQLLFSQFFQSHSIFSSKITFQNGVFSLFPIVWTTTYWIMNFCRCWFLSVFLFLFGFLFFTLLFLGSLLFINFESKGFKCCLLCFFMDSPPLSRRQTFFFHFCRLTNAGFYNLTIHKGRLNVCVCGWRC